MEREREREVEKNLISLKDIKDKQARNSQELDNYRHQW